MPTGDLIISRNTLPLVPEAYAAHGLSTSQLQHIGMVYWKRALLAALAITAAVAAITLLLPKTYTATATLMVNYEVNDPMGGKEFPAGLLGTYVATQVELIQSPQVLAPVVDQLGLAADWHYSAGYHGNPEGLNEWIQHKLADKLQVAQGQGANQLIHVSFSAGDAVQAARAANAIVDTYLEQAAQRQNGPASEEAKRYTGQLDELKAKVAKAQADLTAFRQRNNMVDVQGKSDDEAALLASLEEKLAEAQAQRHAAEARRSGGAAVSGAVLGSGLVQTLKTQLATEEAHLAELRATLGPQHPDVLQLQSQISATRNALSAEIGSYASSAASEVVTAKELEQKQAAAVEQQRGKVLQLRRFQDESANLQLELDSAQAVYKHALEGYDQVLAASSGRYTNTSVVSHATPPAKASKPKLWKNIAAGAVLGLLLGFGGSLLYELLNRRVRCRDDVERECGIPVLAEFPALPAIGSTL